MAQTVRHLAVLTVPLKWHDLARHIAGQCGNKIRAGARLVTLTNRSVGSFSYALVELSSLENEKVVSRLEDSTLHSDTSSRVDVVSGHHSYRYTGLLTLADCIRHLHPISRSSCA